jgi:hypothetical protein
MISEWTVHDQNSGIWFGNDHLKLITFIYTKWDILLLDKNWSSFIDSSGLDKCRAGSDQISQELWAYRQNKSSTKVKKIILSQNTLFKVSTAEHKKTHLY